MVIQQKQAQNTLNQVTSHLILVFGTILADILFQFKENPDAWLLVDKILQEASYPQTKCQWATHTARRKHADML